MEPSSKRRYIGGKNVTVSIRIPAELKKVLAKLSKDYGRSFSDFLQEGLDKWAALHMDLESNKKGK